MPAPAKPPAPDKKTTPPKQPASAKRAQKKDKPAPPIALPTVPKTAAQEATELHMQAQAKQAIADRQASESFMRQYAELCKKTGHQLVARVTYADRVITELIPAKVVGRA